MKVKLAQRPDEEEVSRRMQAGACRSAAVLGRRLAAAFERAGPLLGVGPGTC